MWVHRTVLTKHLLIWSMMVFMICEMIWAKDTMRKMRQKRYDSSAWIVSGGRDTPPKRGTFGELQPSGAHNRQRAISMRLCHGVFTYQFIFRAVFGANFESYKFHKSVSKTYRPKNYICCLLISVPFWYLILRMCPSTWWRFYFRGKKCHKMCLKINWSVKTP